MNRNKREVVTFLVLGLIAEVVLITTFPLSSIGQQVIQQTSPAQIDKRKLEQQQVQQTPEQQKVMRQPAQVQPGLQVNPGVQVNPERLKQPNIPPTDSSGRKPTSLKVDNPAVTDSEDVLSPQPSPSHPRNDGCFIATAAYGSPLAENINLLEKFRDEYLLANSFGQWFVASYYRYSPPVANYIARHETLKLATRAVLWPIVFCVKNMMQIVVFLLLMGATMGVYVMKQRYERKLH